MDIARGCSTWFDAAFGVPCFLLFKIPASEVTFTEIVGTGQGLRHNYDCKNIVQFISRILFATNHNFMVGQLIKVVLDLLAIMEN